MPKVFSCSDCEKNYQTGRGLRKLFKAFPGHKREENVKRPPLQAATAASNFLDVPAHHRSARLKEVLKLLTHDEIATVVLCSISKHVSTSSFLLSRSKLAQGSVQKVALQERLSLNFTEYNGVVAAYTNVKNTVEWLLSKETLQQTIMVPKEKLIIYHYIDAFPWMQWSKCFTGETSIRLKLVEPHNLLSSIVTVCSWLAPDDYNHVSNLGRETLQQLSNLKSVYHRSYCTWCCRWLPAEINYWKFFSQLNVSHS